MMVVRRLRKIKLGRGLGGERWMVFGLPVWIHGGCLIEVDVNDWN
jgi:hypothetical protein